MRVFRVLSAAIVGFAQVVGDVVKGVLFALGVFVFAYGVYALWVATQ